jgi:drug/metabolite transporter (DMT)-like permease
VSAVHWRLVGVALLWAGTFIAGRDVAQHAPHSIVAALRFLIATACLLPLLAIRDGRLALPSRAALGWCAALGATGMLAYNLFFLGALEHMEASRTSLIVALNPIITLLLASAIGFDRLTTRRLLGVAVAFAGVAVVLSRGDASSLWRGGVGIGELLMFGGALSWAAYTLIGQRALALMSPLAATTWSVVVGAVMLSCVAIPQAPAWIASGGAREPAVWLAASYLGIFGSVIAFIWYSQGVQQLGAARTSVFNNLVPVFGVALSALLLREPVHWSMLLGGAVVIGGVLLTTRS